MLLQLLILQFLIDTCVCLDFIYRVDEGKSSDTYVGNIAADTHIFDTVSPEYHDQITFSQLAKNSKSELFRVSKVGKLFTSQVLDAESLCKYNTDCFKTIEVAVKNQESFIKVLEIKVVIEDVNDHPPEFTVDEVEIHFSERDRKGSRLSIPNAIDKDLGVQNSLITYVLKKSKNEPFDLSVYEKLDGTAKLGIVLVEKLDRETKDTYTLQVIAKDGGFPKKQGVLNVKILVKDENDNPPIFTESVYNVSLRNTHPKNLSIVTVLAKDFDSDENGQVSYYFSSKMAGLTKTYFELVKNTGEIFYRDNFPFEQRQTYKLFIEAMDGGNPPLSSTAIVLVNVINQLNNPPSVEVNFFSESTENAFTISEGVKVGSFIAYVKVTDNDVGENGEVTCELQHNKLQLQNLGKKKYKITVKNLIDRETENHLDFRISCQDKGSVPLGTDRNFSIQVTDVNDVKPHFTKNTFKFLTYENEEPNFPVGFINATDPDLGIGGQLSYSLISDQHILPFEISDFGFISTTRSVDYEQQDIYKFKVFVKDNGTPSLNNTANVVVEVMDENDNAPYFTFPSVNPFSLDVHYQPHRKNDVAVLRASDRDSHVNAFLRYEILGGNEKQLFKVNSYTGVLSFSRTVYQNDAGSYELLFVVKDSGTPVLSATTTLSLILTVSNKTAKMQTTVHVETDNRIHINLMILFVVAAVIITIVTAISVIICIVQRHNQKNVPYGSTTEADNKFLDERNQSENVCEQYDIPVTMVTKQEHNQVYQATLLKKEPCAEFQAGHTWKGSAVEIQPQAAVQGTPQVTYTAVNKEKRMVISPEQLNTISTLSSLEGSETSWSESGSRHYETLPGIISYQPKAVQTTDGKALSKSLGRFKDPSATPKLIYQSNVGQGTPCTDIIDLKSIRVGSSGSTIPSQPWNLPMRNSFTSYAKPLPALPKLPYA
ncbi:putative protocadherin beta-18 isoform X1 [Octopus bimaculoides]|uniref:Cadherin domain-containing protein n=1 Tax=Octopus bimaculoides TaxID=37653 RepID=A0A0L8FHF2_OCTBM|nr:putative protocadherin beta-18 isoform X1 [Octopus bimaculoides]